MCKCLNRLFRGESVGKSIARKMGKLYDTYPHLRPVGGDSPATLFPVYQETDNELFDLNPKKQDWKWCNLFKRNKS